MEAKNNSYGNLIQNNNTLLNIFSKLCETKNIYKYVLYNYNSLVTELEEEYANEKKKYNELLNKYLKK
jgi:hypothetical protein